MAYFIVKVEMPHELRILADSATEAEEKAKSYIENYAQLKYIASEPLAPCQLNYACPPEVNNCGECAMAMGFFKKSIDK